MAKSSNSKEKTLLAAAKLFCRQGYHGTALQDILAASGAPRGSLYFHFPRGKEEIAEGAVAIGEKAVRGFIAHVAGTSRTAEAFVINLARGMAANLEASDFREGCPLATTALEIATNSKAIGKATREAFAAWSARSRKHWCVLASTVSRPPLPRPPFSAKSKARFCSPEPTAALSRCAVPKRRCASDQIAPSTTQWAVPARLIRRAELAVAEW